MANIASFCLSRLKSIDISTAPDLDYAKVDGLTIYADSLCNWRRGDDLLETIIDWLKQDTEKEGDQSKKGVRFAESTHNRRPELALILISYLFQHPINRVVLLRKNADKVEDLISVLTELLPKLSSKLSKSRYLSNAEVKFWNLVWESILKLAILNYNKSSEESKNEAISRIEKCISWFDGTILTNQELFSLALSQNMVKFLVKICSNVVAIGLCDDNLISHRTDIYSLLPDQCEADP